MLLCAALVMPVRTAIPGPLQSPCSVHAAGSPHGLRRGLAPAPHLPPTAASLTTPLTLIGLRQNRGPTSTSDALSGSVFFLSGGTTSCTGAVVVGRLVGWWLVGWLVGWLEAH